MFITRQVDSNNDQDLAEAVLPGTELPFPDAYLIVQKNAFEDVSFEIIDSDETFDAICFYNTGTFVWFARNCCEKTGIRNSHYQLAVE